MNKEIMQKWIKALRSGNYKQGKFKLRNSKNEFCCLGVLCNLHAEAHPEIARTEYSKGSYMGYSIHLPEDVCKWAELSCPGGGFRYETGKIESLESLNDNGTSFSDIADIIEENYHNL